MRILTHTAPTDSDIALLKSRGLTVEVEVVRRAFAVTISEPIDDRCTCRSYAGERSACPGCPVHDPKGDS